MPLLLDAHDPSAIEVAAQRLAAGQLLAFPTETVYGLGARADDDAAVAQIFTAKGRPSDHPLIVHVADAAAAEAFAQTVPAVARKLMDAFWPGPVTVIVPRRAAVAGASAGGQDSIGLRCPDHPLALALLRRAAELGVAGVAAPSANRFGRISPTCANHVMQEFAHLPDSALAVLDGGACAVGIESAIVDCTGSQPALLRPGALTREALARALAAPDLADRRAGSPRASGTLEAHYAPQARLRLMDAAQLRSALELIGSDLQASPGMGPVLALYSRSPLGTLTGASASNRTGFTRASRELPPRVTYRKMPDAAPAAAHELFAALRELDASGVRLIWVESVPDAADWDGVRDRLSRAAAAGNPPHNPRVHVAPLKTESS